MRENGIETRRTTEIDMRKLLLANLRSWWLIVACALVIGAASLFYTMKFVDPTYRASVTIIVNNRSSDKSVEEITGSNLTAAQRLVETYINVVSSDSVLNRVVKRARLDYSAEEVRGMISAHQVGGTEMFQVVATHTDPAIAARVVNAIATESLDGIGEYVEGSSAKVVDYAQIPTKRSSPSYSRSGVTGAVVGGLAAVAFVTVRCLMDVRLKTKEDLEELFDMPVLGQVPSFATPAEKGEKYGYITENDEEENEADEAGKEQDR